jgi:hypothetical protein
MLFEFSKGRIRIHSVGYTVSHNGTVYLPPKVTLTNTATDFVAKKLSREEDHDVIIDGSVHNDEIIVTNITLPIF